MSSPDPDELLRQLDPELAELKAKAEQVQEQVAASSSTTRSPDGSVTVTVGPGGNLTGLNLTERAYERPPAQLAAQIMQLASQAQQQVSAQMLAAFSGLVGADSPALDVLTPFLPPEPAADESAETQAPHPDEPYEDHLGGFGTPAAPPQGYQPPAPPPPPPAAPPQAGPQIGDLQRRPKRRRDTDQEVEADYDEGDLWT